MILLKEDETKKFSMEESAMEFFQTQEREQLYINCYTKELTAFPIDCGPIFAEDMRTSQNMPVTNDSIIEGMNSTKMGLLLPGETKFFGYPLSITGYQSLVQRAGFAASPILIAQKNKTGANEMPAALKAVCLNHGLHCHTNKVLCLIRDEKIRAVLSEEYSVLSMPDLINVLDEELPLFGGHFKEATASHIEASVMYELEDKPLRNDLSLILNKTKGKPYLRLRTSDIGASGANIFLGIRAASGAEYPLGLPLRLIHKGSNLEDFRRNINAIQAHFKDIAEKLNELESKSVSYPSGMISAIGKKLSLPKKDVLILANIVGNTYSSCTQLDIYYELVTLINSVAEEGSPEKLFAFEENLCRIVFAGMSEYDYPYSWD